MKEFILSFTILLSFLKGEAQLFHEDFEVADSVNSSGTQGWFPNNRISVGGSFCDSSSIQNVGDTSILSTFFFDCSTSSKIFLSFDHICKIDFFDRAVIEVSNDSGNTFVSLDNFNSYYSGQALTWGTPFNNFNFSFNAASYSHWLQAVNDTTPENSWWKNEIFNLNSLLSFKPYVIIRFKLFDGNNDGGNLNHGWFIDNLRVDTIAPPDAGVTSILNFDVTSAANSLLPIDVLVKNYGADTAYFFNAGYTINAGAPVILPWTGLLAPGDSVTVALPAALIPSGSFSICAFTQLPGDFNLSNDTLCITGIGLPILPVPYSDDFEGPNIGWLDPNPITEPTIWEAGTPSYGVTNSAHSGIRSWDTNLDTSYLGPCNAVLYSPYFDFSTIGNASVSFWLNYKTEPFSDGTRLEYNANSAGWFTLGLANNPLLNNWYTDSLINSSQKPGWEGNSGGWKQYTYPLPSHLSNQNQVQFRFVFSADNAVNSDGVSLDDFSVSLSGCGNTIYSSSTSTGCGDSITFGFTSSSPIANIHWDLGNGITSSQPTVSGFFTTGNYPVTLFTTDSNGCSASSVNLVVVNTGFSAYAGPDLISCAAAAQLNATVSVAGSYQYNWSPATGLNNPLIASPTANHIDSLTYILTVTDTITGCISTDEITASVFSGFNDNLTMCIGSAAILDLGPGANTYLWQVFTDTTGNIIPLNNTTQQLFITQPGTYNATAVFPLCGVMNSIFSVNTDTTCVTVVWPGDCNFDLTADNLDLLNIGVAYGDTGIIRSGANISWTPQATADWPLYFASGINYKHSDTDGNGVIDSVDISAILLNYGTSHPLKPGDEPIQPANVPAIFLTADMDTAGNSDLITVTVNLGTTAVPVDSIYGIAYSINYDASLIDTISGAGNFSNSWLGNLNNNLLVLEKHFASVGVSDFSMVRNDHINALNGSGPLAVFTIVTTDNLSGIAKLHFNLVDVTAITYGQKIIPLTTVGDSVILDPAYTAISDPGAIGDIFIYPNPVSSDLTIRSKHTRIISAELKNTLGQTIRVTTGTGETTRVDVSDLTNGIFFLSVLTDKGVISKKVQVNK